MSDESNREYYESLKRLRDAAHGLIDVMDDPFKAPELFIEPFREVMNAGWEAQIEYAAMLLAGERRRNG